MININHNNYSIYFTFPKECERSEHSYSKLPDFYYRKTCTSTDPLVKENINSIWVSIPHGSEHYSFSNMRKNGYEEALFRVDINKKMYFF